VTKSDLRVKEMRLLAVHLWSLLATTSMAIMTSMATITTTIATSLAMVDFVGAKSSPWDWQKGTGEYAKFAAYEEELRAMASQPYFRFMSQYHYQYLNISISQHLNI